MRHETQASTKSAGASDRVDDALEECRAASAEACYVAWRGLRVPGLVISPYARRGYIDHQTLSFDAYLKFIEDDFLASERIDPSTDGRPDSRPDVRENAAVLGDLRQDFEFTRTPRPPLVLPTVASPPAA